MSESSDNRAKDLEARGVNMDWYWRGRKRRGSSDEEFEEEKPTNNPCSYISIFKIEYEQGSSLFENFANIYTLKTGVDQIYKLHQRRITKKIGEPIYWCSSCGKVFKDYTSIHGHLYK